jgi:hypothetical protein
MSESEFFSPLFPANSGAGIAGSGHPLGFTNRVLLYTYQCSIAVTAIGLCAVVMHQKIESPSSAWQDY